MSIDPATSADFFERTPDGAERSGSTAGGSLVTGQALMKFGPITGLSNENLADLFNQWLGTTQDATNNGRLQRTLPVAHPYLHAWVANSIQNIQGIGQFTLMPSDANLLPYNPNPFDKFGLYHEYELTVAFGPRDYPMFTDDIISSATTSTYYPRSTNNVAKSYKYVNEYYRFTDWTELPQDNSITGRQGQMQFWAPGLTGLNGVDRKSFSDMPKQYLPDAIVKLQWFQVPYRYVTSPKSFLKRLKGLVNQKAFPPDSPNPVWLPGEMLYLTYNAKKYTRPPSSDLATSQTPYMGNNTFQTYSKLCDIELVFLTTKRAFPNPGETAPAPSNGNYVVGGHNLMPATSIDRLFHYAQTAKEMGGGVYDVTQGRPFWYSAPLELLFMDPDYLQPADSLDSTGQLLL